MSLQGWGSEKGWGRRSSGGEAGKGPFWQLGAREVGARREPWEPTLGNTSIPGPAWLHLGWDHHRSAEWPWERRLPLVPRPRQCLRPCTASVGPSVLSNRKPSWRR